MAPSANWAVKGQPEFALLRPVLVDHTLKLNATRDDDECMCELTAYELGDGLDKKVKVEKTKLAFVTKVRCRPVALAAFPASHGIAFRRAFCNCFNPSHTARLGRIIF